MAQNVRRLILFSSALLVGALGVGGYVAYLKGMEWAKTTDRFRLTEIAFNTGDLQSPLAQTELLEILGLAHYRDQFFSVLNLDPVALEGKLKANTWIESAQVERKFPHTLLVQLSYREPIAFLKNTKMSKEYPSTLSYIDSKGVVFGHVNLLTHSDLPGFFLPMGTSKSDFSQADFQAASAIVQKWSQLQLSNVVSLASLSWAQEKGFTVLGWYQIGSEKVRTLIELGDLVDKDWDSILDNKLVYLKRVVTYLSSNSIATHLILLDQLKKVVVKTP